MKKYILNHPNFMNAFSISLIVLLGAQFLLGIYTNLFVDFPQNVLGWIVIHNDFIASAHLFLGSALTVLAIISIYASVVMHNRRWIIVSIVGIGCILIAALNGVAFAGSQDDINSFFMSVGFILAMLNYSYILYLISIPEKNKVPKEDEGTADCVKSQKYPNIK